MFPPLFSREAKRHGSRCDAFSGGGATYSSAFLARRRDQIGAKSRRLPARYARRRGVAFVYTALGLTVALMVAAVVVDVGLLYQRKAAMQRAADSAALAGAFALANSGGVNDAYGAYIAAGRMAARPENGGYTKVSSLPGSFTSQYVANVGNSKFIVTYPAKDEKGLVHDNWFKVTLSRPEPALFSGMWPLGRSELGVTASAIAIYDKSADLEIKGTGVYGVAPGPVNLSVFGPNGRYSYGDCYSTRFLNDGSPNPRYNSNGYDFRIDVPATQRQTSVEIFDPDCYNANNLVDATWRNGQAVAIDEMRTRTGQGTIKDATTTQYKLYYDNGTPLNKADDIVIGTRSWGGNNDGDSDMKWVDAFNFDRGDPRFQVPNGNFHLNVLSTDGSSENGFDLRAGPKREATTTYETERYVSSQLHFKGTLSSRYRGYAPNSNSGIYYDIPAGPYDFYDPVYSERQVPKTTPAPDWDSNNGTRIIAEGHLPINFNVSGTVKMALGKIPPGAGGGTLTITKFDTDINSQSITYTCDKLPGKSWPGTLSTDGTFAVDKIKIPDSYRALTEAGTWYAEYVAGDQDTSVWDMSYTGNGPGNPGNVRLIR